MFTLTYISRTRVFQDLGPFLTVPTDLGHTWLFAVSIEWVKMAPELVVFLFLWVLRRAKVKVWMTIVEWVECMGVASGCGEQEVGVANGSGWNLWVWLLGVVVRRYIDFLILLIPTPLVPVLFYSSIPTFC